MNLFEVTQKLSYGHLSELAIGGSGSGSIPTEHVPKIVHHIGNALISLYTKFPLQIKTVDIETVDGLYDYVLQSRYALTSSSTEPVKYIKDSGLNPFLGDVLKITGIMDTLTGTPIALNKREDLLSWYIQSYDSVRMFYPVSGTGYRIEYHARHASLPLNPTETEQEAIDIRIPPELEAALLAHVATNVYGSMSMEGSLIKSQNFYAMYENECNSHERNNTWDQHHAPENLAFQRGGWV